MRNTVWTGAIALFMAGNTCLAQAVRVAEGGAVRVDSQPPPPTAQAARVAGKSIKYHPDQEKKELGVEFRLVDNLAVTSVQVTAASGEALPAKWDGWKMDRSPACAWIIVVDTSNSSSAKTVSQYVEFVRAFLKYLPKQDPVAVYGLAGELKEMVPFESTPEECAKGLAGIKRAGGGKSTTLIYAGLRGVLESMAARKETRQAVLVLTNGQDQTEGGAEAKAEERTKLIDAANSTGVVLHTLGCAETPDGKKYFMGLKEISSATDGLFEAPLFGGEELPFGTMYRLGGVMHGAGTARLDLSKLAQPEDLTVTVKTVVGRSAVVQVPRDKVAEALGAALADNAAKELEEARQVQEAARKADAAKAEAARLAEQEAAKKAEADKTAKQEADTKSASDQPAKDVAEPAGAATRPKSATKTTSRFPLWMWMLAGGGVLVLLLVIVVVLFLVLRKRGA